MAARLVGTFGKKIRSVKRAYGLGRYSTKKRIPRRYSPEKFSESRRPSRTRTGLMSPHMFKQQSRAQTAYMSTEKRHAGARKKLVRRTAVGGVAGGFAGLAVHSERKKKAERRQRRAKKRRG